MIKLIFLVLIVSAGLRRISAAAPKEETQGTFGVDRTDVDLSSSANADSDVNAEITMASIDAFQKKWNRIQSGVRQQYQDLFDSAQRDFEKEQARTYKLWRDKVMPSKTQFVQYSDDHKSRVLVDYESGEVIAETLASDSHVQLNKIIATLVATEGIEKEDILTKKDLDIPKTQNLNSVLEKKTAQAKRTSWPVEKARVVIQMTAGWRTRREQVVVALVQKWASVFDIDPAFTMAIIRAESAFNPKARSPVGAIGLMQIMPQYAGKEVATRLNEINNLSPAKLADPVINIKYGTYYLKLLREEYFNMVQSKDSKTTLITAAYNWGPANVHRALAKYQVPINSSRSMICEFIDKHNPQETRVYVERVLKYYQEYKNYFVTVIHSSQLHKSTEESVRAQRGWYEKKL